MVSIGGLVRTPPQLNGPARGRASLRLPPGAALALLLLGAACNKRAPEPEPRVTEDEDEDDHSIHYTLVDPASVTPLDVLYAPEPVGDGYERGRIEFGPPLYSGKWLGFDHGESRFIGPKHIIVNHFRQQSPNPFLADVIKSVLLDVETGEVVAEFEVGRYVQHYWGLALVYKVDDPRPYLLDIEHGDMVLALPAGEHEYVNGENYWLRFSPIAKRVWIYARDRAGVVHLYEWEDRRAPPELPNNPFPFVPHTWDPQNDDYRSPADTEEVRPWSTAAFPACSRAVLIPPKGYECLDEYALEETNPLSGGWRVARYGRVFNRYERRGLDFSSLCPEGDDAYAGVLQRSPPRVRIMCGQDRSFWAVWTPPDRVQRLDPEYASLLTKAKLLIRFHDDIVRHEISEPDREGVQTSFNPQTLLYENVGSDFTCPNDQIVYRPGTAQLWGVGCMVNWRPRWFELVDVGHRLRARFQAVEIAVSRGDNAAAVAIVRRGGRDQVVTLRVRAAR